MIWLLNPTGLSVPLASLLMEMITSMKLLNSWGAASSFNYTPVLKLYAPLIASKFQFQKEATIRSNITMFTVKSLILTEEPLCCEAEQRSGRVR